MQLLKYFFRNIFNDTRITDERLRNFTTDHLKRLDRHNADGAFSLLITDTTAAFEEYYGFSEPEDTAAGGINAANCNLEEIIWQFKAKVAEKEAILRSTFKKGTPAYANFFPRGLAEYTKATKETIGPLMKRFAEMATRHQNHVGSSFAGTFTGLHSSYASATQPAAGTGTATVALTYRRAHLEQQLCRNLHYIAYHYSGDTEACFRLIDPSILRLRLADEPEAFSGVIFFGATINVISMGITHHTVFRVRNTGNVPLRCSLAESADSDNAEKYLEVDPHQEILIKASELDDPSTNRFFNISNLSDDIGRYEVLMEE